jgi:hypothetical protein
VSLALFQWDRGMKSPADTPLDVERHPEAARKMAEVAGVIPPPGSEHLLSVNITATK